jgi:general stress protein YciG
MNADGSNVRKPRGFAALTPERRREISHKGGVSAHVKGSAHEWDSGAAREAGRKGGLAHGRRTMNAGPQLTPTPIEGQLQSPASAGAGPPPDTER